MCSEKIRCLQLHHCRSSYDKFKTCPVKDKTRPTKNHNHTGSCTLRSSTQNVPPNRTLPTSKGPEHLPKGSFPLQLPTWSASGKIKTQNRCFLRFPSQIRPRNKRHTGTGQPAGFSRGQHAAKKRWLSLAPEPCHPEPSPTARAFRKPLTAHQLLSNTNVQQKPFPHFCMHSPDFG